MSVFSNRGLDCPFLFIFSFIFHLFIINFLITYLFIFPFTADCCSNDVSLFLLALMYASSALLNLASSDPEQYEGVCRYLLVCKQGWQFSLHMVSRQQQLVVISKYICCLLSPLQLTCCGSKGSKSFTSTSIPHKIESCIRFPYVECLLCSDDLVQSF